MTDEKERRDKRMEAPAVLTAAEVLGTFAGLGLSVTDDNFPVRPVRLLEAHLRQAVTT